MSNNYNRFSNKVQDYIKYRPQYPPEIINKLEENLVLKKTDIIADIGSGTGISSLPFLEKNYIVLGVEPNKDMRLAAEDLLKNFKTFRSIEGTAEETSLKDDSIDLIFCAQSFHWFDIEKTKIEFLRILKNKGHIVLAWNEKDSDSIIQQEYEKIIIKYIEEFEKVTHKNINKELITQFLAPFKTSEIILNNQQIFTLDEFKGRARSSSYVPNQGKIFNSLMLELEKLFLKHQKNNLLEFKYKTKIYFAQIEK